MILIINKSKKDARGLSDMFYYMGVLALGLTPSEALSEISPTYRAVIVMNPNNTLADKEDYVLRLRSYANVPIFAMTDSYDASERMIFDGVISSSAYSSKIYKCLCEYASKYQKSIPGKYKLAGIDASADLQIPVYYNTPLPFTKTETMILRTLIRVYPVPMCSKEILKYAFRAARAPEIANIRTHISVMNKKFREISGRNIAVMEQGEGYRILTPKFTDRLITV